MWVWVWVWVWVWEWVKGQGERRLGERVGFPWGVCVELECEDSTGVELGVEVGVERVEVDRRVWVVGSGSVCTRGPEGFGWCDWLY